MTRRYLPEAVQRNPGPFAPRAILGRFVQYLNDLVLTHIVVMNMRQASRWIDIKSGLQASRSHSSAILLFDLFDSARLIHHLQRRKRHLPSRN